MEFPIKSVTGKYEECDFFGFSNIYKKNNKYYIKLNNIKELVDFINTIDSPVIMRKHILIYDDFVEADNANQIVENN